MRRSQSETEHLLPWRPRPQPDELFSSWLCRVAYGNAPKLHTFCHAMWPGLQIWNRDIDRMVAAPMLGDLARVTGVHDDQLGATLLSRYSGVIFDGEVDANAWRPWVLPLGIYHRTRRRAGTQWCSRCLSFDDEPYYRKRWRLALTTACLEHHCLLHDRCEACGAPASMHRLRDPVCHLCGADRRCASFREADPTVLALQSRFEAIMEGCEPRDALESCHPLAYFGTLRRVVQTVTTGPRSQRLRNHLAGLYGGDSSPPAWQGPERSVESLHVIERHRMLRFAAPLLRGWPWMLVGLLGEAGVWKSWALPDGKGAAAPFVYADPVLRFL